jgi:hypothetical protein
MLNNFGIAVCYCNFAPPRKFPQTFYPTNNANSPHNQFLYNLKLVFGVKITAALKLWVFARRVKAKSVSWQKKHTQSLSQGAPYAIKAGEMITTKEPQRKMFGKVCKQKLHSGVFRSKIRGGGPSEG